jgi:dienelactone hydrolase
MIARLAIASLLTLPLAASAESVEEWRKAFATPDAKFEAAVEERLDRNDYKQFKVTFPSPVETSIEENNTVHGHLFEPKKKTGAAVIVLPIWKGRGLDLEFMVGQRLALKGMTAFVMELPYQFSRAPDGRRSGDLTVSSDLERSRDAVVQGVKDARRAARWLVDARGADGRKLGVTGISLGGHIAALAWAVAPEFDACATVLAGGNVHELFWNESSETKEIKEELEGKGVTLGQLAELMKPYDPITFATPERGRGLLMIGAKDDPVVPIRNVRALRDAFGGPRLIVYPGNHYSVVLSIADILGDLSAHFESRFERELR